MKLFTLEYPCGKDSRLVQVTETQLTDIIVALMIYDQIKGKDHKKLIDDLLYVVGDPNE